MVSFLQSNAPEAHKTDGDHASHGKHQNESTEKQPLASVEETELDSSITTLGGRLTDLEFLARRIQAGETPKRAVSEIVEQSASEILKLFLTRSSDHRKYSPEQAWHLIKALASQESLKYNEVLLHDLFKSEGESAIASLEQSELITVAEAPGTSRPAVIKAGRPVYLSAFRQLMSDRVLKAKLDLSTYSELIKVEGKTIEKAENELHVLGELPRTTYDVVPRAKYLLKKIKDSQDKVEKYEKEQKKAKKLLAELW